LKSDVFVDVRVYMYIYLYNIRCIYTIII